MEVVVKEETENDLPKQRHEQKCKVKGQLEA